MLCALCITFQIVASLAITRVLFQYRVAIFFILHLNDRSFVVTLACFTYICTKKTRKKAETNLELTHLDRCLLLCCVRCATLNIAACWNSNRIICIGIVLRMRYSAHWREHYTHGANAWSWFLLWLIMPYVFAFQHKHHETGKLYTDRNVYL